MQTIDLTKNGGFPFTQNALAFMQNSYTELFAAIGRCYGSKTIIVGMEVGGSSIAEGWLVYEGEIIKFTPCAIDTKISISQTLESVEFEDGLTKAVYYVKTAVCAATGDFDYSELKRAAPFTTDKKNEYDSVWMTGDIKMISCSNAYRDVNFDTTGLGRLERLGWGICNGQGGRANMCGRVPIGYDQNTINPNDNVWDISNNTLGATTGGKAKTIAKTNLPAVGIDVSIPKEKTSVGESGSGFITMGGGGNEPVDGPTLTTANLGDGTPINVIQPSIVTLFIQKL